MANRYDDYMNKRSWLVDTAETAQDKKALPGQLKKLDKAISWASRSPRTQGGISNGTPGAKNVTPVYREMGK